MVRIGERALQHERCAVLGRGVALERGDRAFLDEGRRVEILGHRGAPGLRRMNGRGQRMRRTDQAVDVRTARSRPCAVVAAHLIGVAAGELDLLEPVVRQVDAARRIGRPELFSLGQIARVVRVIGQCGRPSLEATLRSVHRWPHRGEQQRIGHLAPRLRLQMRLADECGAITGAAQHLGEGQRPERQRHAVVPDAVDRGHAAGEHRSAVRHADGVGDIAALEAPALRRQRVDVRRAHHAVAVAAEMIGAVLVGDDEQEIRADHPRNIAHPADARRCGTRGVAREDGSFRDRDTAAGAGSAAMAGQATLRGHGPCGSDIDDP